MKKFYIIPSLAMFYMCSGSAQAQLSEEFTTAGTHSFTVPLSVSSITVEVVGAGGSGGGNGTGGGGGGGYASGTFSVTPGSTHTIVVGAGGSSTTGGTTSFDALISATGGMNGTSVPHPSVGGGGAGGVGTGGTVNHTGGAGGGGYWTYFGGGGGGAAGPLSNGTDGGNTIPWTGVCMTPGGDGGTGGGAPGGDGGKGAGFTDPSCNVTDPAGNGGNYGAGGGGGNGNGGDPGTGASGYCKVSWVVTTGVQQITHDKTIAVSPNPFTSHINVQHAKGDETYVLSSSNGQLIWTGSDIAQQDFSTLGTGTYLLRVTSVNGEVHNINLVK